MQITVRLRGFFLVSLFLIFIPSAVSAEGPAFDTTFNRSRGDWNLDRRVSDKPSLQWPKKKGAPGLRFVSHGMDLLTRPFEVGTKPFEFSVDLTLTKGTGTKWPRNKGVNIVISSAPVDDMKKDDWAILFSVIQAGVRATVQQGGVRYAVPKNKKNYTFPGSEVEPARSLTGGMASTSVSWPSKTLDGRDLRLHVHRDRKHQLTFSIYHGDAPLGPWWTGQVTLPEKLRRIPLNLITIHTGRDKFEFKNLKETVISPGKARKMVNGYVRRVRGRPLKKDQDPICNQPLPNEYSPSTGKPPTLFASDDRREKLRKKLKANHFQSSLKILREVADKDAKKIREGSSAGLTYIAFLYRLYEEKKYLPVLKKGIRMQAGVSNAWVDSGPGHLQQQLDLKTFKAHRFVGMSMAYAAIGDRLTPKLRKGVELELMRFLRHYREQVKKGSWWYANGSANGSNTIGVAAGCSGIAALALRDAMPEKSSNVLDLATRTLKNKYRAVRPDGSCVEGPMYWEYGTLFPILLARALNHVEGSNRGLLKSLQVHRADQYAHLMLGGDGNGLTFNDTQPFLPGLAPMVAGASVTDAPLLRWLSDHIPKKALRVGKFSYSRKSMLPVLLYRSRKPAPKNMPNLPTLKVLHGVEQAVMRSEGTLKPRLMTAVKGMGKVHTHHANQDQGSFALYAGGEYLLIDPGYFEPKPVDHSLVLPDVEKPEKIELDQEAPAPVSGREQGTLRAVRVNATAAYQNGKHGAQSLSAVRRIFVQVGDRATVILDDIRASQNQQKLVSRFQTGYRAVGLHTNGRFRIRAKRMKLDAFVFGPETSIGITQAKNFSDGSWYFPVYMKRNNGAWHTVQVRHELDPERPLVTVLAPYEKNSEKQTGKPNVTYGNKTITVKLKNDQTITFKKKQNQWQAVLP